MSALPTANLSAQLQRINCTEYRLGSGVETEGPFALPCEENFYSRLYFSAPSSQPRNHACLLTLVSPERNMQ